MVQHAITLFFDELEAKTKLADLIEESIPEVIRAALEDSLAKTPRKELTALAETVEQTTEFMKAQISTLKADLDSMLVHVQLQIVYAIAIGVDFPRSPIVFEALEGLIQDGFVTRTTEGEYLLAEHASQRKRFFQ